MVLYADEAAVVGPRCHPPFDALTLFVIVRGRRASLDRFRAYVIVQRTALFAQEPQHRRPGSMAN